MTSELKERIWKERLLSLAFAAPFLVFVVPGIYAGFSNFPNQRAVIFTILEVIFVLNYIAVWPLNDPAPVRQHFTKTYLISIGTLWALITVLLLFHDYVTVFNIVYLGPAIVFLTPRKYLTPTVITYVAYSGLGIAGVYLLGSSTRETVLTAGGVITMSLVVVTLARGQMDRERQSEIEQIRAKNLSVEEERNRMASDLHDVLGQTLTAINTISQLSAKLLERGQVDQARETQEQIAQLSREALQQMRAVVHSRQTLSISEELDRAYQLLTAANISVSTSVEVHRLPDHVEDAAAHVIREGAANIVHHSLASHCQITVSKEGVRITDDGRYRARGQANNPRAQQTAPSNTTANHTPAAGAPEQGPSKRAPIGQTSADFTRRGHGIENLQARVEGIGTVTAGPLPSGNGWVLQLHLDPALTTTRPTPDDGDDIDNRPEQPAQPEPVMRK
ncbi:MAG: histidine kinase [Actinomycetaceae bacterium]|nr:histidine kinase [Actinomycetaceae bacterium]